MDFIQGEKFALIANNENIFYMHTHDVNAFLLSNKIPSNFILISHNSDGKIIDGGELHPHANSNLIPSNLIHWFGQNVCVNHDKISSLPIGLENSQWFIEVGKRNKIQSKVNEQKQYKNLLYINHNIETNPNERIRPYELFRNSSYATCVNGFNGLDFDSYLDNIYNHKFVLCPEGNGTDTHRTWECLYLNTIPIEKKNINNSFYRDLPICFVNDWDQITEDFLNAEYERITSTKYNLQKLTFQYWKNLIEDLKCL